MSDDLRKPEYLTHWTDPDEVDESNLDDVVAWAFDKGVDWGRFNAAGDLSAERGRAEQAEALAYRTRDALHALQARIDAASVEAQELTRQGYPTGVLLRVLAGAALVSEEPAPEPPKLDPLPYYIEEIGYPPEADEGRYSVAHYREFADESTAYALVVFLPRRGFEQDRAKYEVRS